MRKPKYQLSPNEVERLVKEERDRLRKFRIVQVREQAKANAATIRNQVKQEKNRLLRDFTNEVKNEVLAEKEEKLRKMEQKYDSTLRSIGQGHTEVVLNGDGQQLQERSHKRIEDREKADERYKSAIERHNTEKAAEEWEATRNIRNRAFALEVEEKRSAHMASLPPPPTDNMNFNAKPIIKKSIPMMDMMAFATTHYHMPDFQVVKANQDEQLYDAKNEGEQTDQRLKQDLQEKKRSQIERHEKARIRGNQALEKEMLKHDLSDMMKDLSLLQRKDRRRRQVLLADVPNQVFVPPEGYLQDKQDKQVEMERQFEQMISHTLADEETSIVQAWSEMHDGDDSCSQTSETQSTLESVPLPPTQKPKTVDTKSDTVLKQLLTKIKEQRRNVIANQQSKGDDSRRTGIDVDKQKSTATPEDLLRKQMDDDNQLSQSQSLGPNNDLIAELQQRIHRIEEQKSRLSDQLNSQVDFYAELQKQQEELHNLNTSKAIDEFPCRDDDKKLHSGIDDDKDITLEDVSLPGRSIPSPDLKGKSSQLSRADVNDIKNVASRLIPVPGVVGGVMSPEFELLASNGFLPSQGIEAMNGKRFGEVENRCGLDLDFPAGDINSRIKTDVDDEVNEFKERRDEKDDIMSGKMCQFNSASFMKEGLGARRMINFGEASGSEQVRGDLKRGKEVFGNDNLSKETDNSNHFLAMGMKLNDSRSDDGSRESSILMNSKMDEYCQRGQEMQRSMDDSTLSKVREYQQRILQTHQERRQMLQDVRNDIEQRRQALHTSNSRFVGTSGAFLMNLGRVGSDDIANPTSNRFNIPQSISSSYPTLLASHSNFDSLKTTAQSKSDGTLEPIKPFLADPWIGVKAKTHSILKNQSSFSMAAQLNIGSEINFQQGKVQSELNENSDLKQNKPASTLSIDKIRKSLAFDDLNDSDIDATPSVSGNNHNKQVINDSFNDTPASKHSQGTMTDDSKLTTSEEDRGSPVLRWDLSDKSNNSILTGSSSLNGSALVAHAEQRREGFERRQEDLRNQLMDIQKQKEAIMMRYNESQKTIQNQQQSLRDKLLLSDASIRSPINIHSPQLLSEYQGENQPLPRSFKTDSQPTANLSFSNRDNTELGVKSRLAEENISIASKMPSVSFDFNIADLEARKTWSSKLSDFQSDGNVAASAATLGFRQGSGKGNYHQSSFNSTGDEFLEDISYCQMEAEDKLPMGSTTSVLNHKVSGDRNLSSGKGDISITSTWASILSSGRDDASHGDSLIHEEQASFDENASSFERNGKGEEEHDDMIHYKPDTLFDKHYEGECYQNDDIGTPSLIATAITNDFTSESGIGSGDVCHNPQTPVNYGRMYNRHDLSTILEVDTPTASASQSVAGSQSLHSLFSSQSDVGGLNALLEKRREIDEDEQEDDSDDYLGYPFSYNTDYFPELPKVVDLKK